MYKLICKNCGEFAFKKILVKDPICDDCIKKRGQQAWDRFHKRNPNTGKTLIICLNCNKQKYARSYLVKRGDGRFCSTKCVGIYRRKRIYPTKQEIEKLYFIENKSVNEIGKIFGIGEGRVSVLAKRYRIKFYPRNLSFHHGKPWNYTGLSKSKRDINSERLRITRKKVFERDDYTCQKCGERGGKLNMDHIIRFSDAPHLEFEMSNLQTLCIKCHREKTVEEAKKYWINQFSSAEKINASPPVSIKDSGG
jgi:HNH endonuclease